LPFAKRGCRLDAGRPERAGALDAGWTLRVRQPPRPPLVESFWLLKRERMAGMEETIRIENAVIEQAKGVLAERLVVDVEEASWILRHAARFGGVKILDLAARVVREEKTPEPIIVALARDGRLRSGWLREVAEAHRVLGDDLYRSLADLQPSQSGQQPAS
jgi:ANTAR domain